MREDQNIRIFRQFDTVQCQLQQITVIFGIPDQHRTQQIFIIVADNQPLINLIGFIEINITVAAVVCRMCIADTTDIHTQQFQFCAHIRTGKLILLPQQMISRHLCHFVAGATSP